MKKTITSLSLALSIFTMTAQTTVADFETFTLSANSAYSPTTSTSFQTSNATFQYEWDNSFSYWSAGFSYTNKYDSITAGYTNLYGVRALKGYSNSATYVIGQDESTIKLATPHKIINGFYITNTTYAYKSMASGDAFARKFGDTTGTGSGTTIAQGSYPDFFKVVVKGYTNGALKNDSVTIFLANFTFTNNAQDFILDSWQYVNTSSMGEVDSVQFFMRSSDVGPFGINTPLYFALDNFETSIPNPVGMATNSMKEDFVVYPNPFTTSITIRSASGFKAVVLRDISGKMLYDSDGSELHFVWNLEFLESGIYFLEIDLGEHKQIKKIIKN